MKSTKIIAIHCSIGACLIVAAQSQAAIVVIDGIDSSSTQVNIGLSEVSLSFFTPIISGASKAIGLSATSPLPPDERPPGVYTDFRLGIGDPGEPQFSSGDSLVPTRSFGPSGDSDTAAFGYQTTTDGSPGNPGVPVYGGGAGQGLRYFRFDIEGDGVFEGVVEVEFGPDVEDCSAHIFRSVIFDDEGGDLDIPQAIAAMNAIPEPSSSLLVLLGFLGLLGRRSR